jgi:glutamate carboxypeptidase
VALGEAVAEVERLHGVAIHVHGGISRPPKPLTPPALALFTLVRTCGAALGQTIGWKDTGGVCDGNNIAALGVPVVDTMGVRGIDPFAARIPDRALAGERAALSALVLHRLSGENGLHDVPHPRRARHRS